MERMTGEYECLPRGMQFYRLVTTVFISAIKVWDFQAALDPRAPTEGLCLRTLVVSSL